MADLQLHYRESYIETGGALWVSAAAAVVVVVCILFVSFFVCFVSF